MGDGGRRARVLRGMGALAALALVVFGVRHVRTSGPAPEGRPTVSNGGQRPASAGRDPAPPAESPPALEIRRGDWSWKRRGGSAVVSGRVRNVSSAPLRDVVAEVSFFDGDGRFISSGEALVSLSPIPAGQTSPFEVVTAWNPAMQEARVGFQDVMGAAFPTRRGP